MRKWMGQRFLSCIEKVCRVGVGTKIKSFVAATMYITVPEMRVSLGWPEKHFLGQ
jgi:hypothetical protein